MIQDLMHPSLAKERARHKKKRLVQSPNSYFMDVKCVGKGCSRRVHSLYHVMFLKLMHSFHVNDSPGCYRITTIFSHAQTVVPCTGCSLILCQPRGGKCRLTEGGIEKTITFLHFDTMKWVVLNVSVWFSL